MMALYKERGINPAAGCLPVFIQMPILIGFYHAISRMNNTPEINLGDFAGFTLAEPSILLGSSCRCYAINRVTHRSSNG